MPGATLHALVDLALSKPCQFAEENFAGDPLVLAFCDRLRTRQRLDLTFFVSWACPPDVLVLRRKGGGAVVRSERLDTLLVEYHNLSRVFPTAPADLADQLMGSTLLRWACELLLGYRQPALAVHANLMKPNLNGIRLHSPFRDETLASIEELPRAALQCFTLAHEVGHIVMPRRKDANLDFEIDGTSMADHIRWSDREAVTSPKHLEALEIIWKAKLDSANLVSEVEADLFAFAAVVDYLCNELSFQLSEAIEATLRAFEAQLFICACKNSCRLLAAVAKGDSDEADFELAEYLIGAEYAARARAVVRRAGITWATAENQDTSAKAIDFNAYARRVDSMLTPTIGFRTKLFETLHVQFKALFLSASELRKGGASLHSHDYIALVENNADVRLEFFYILISFGCPGSVDVVEYLRSIDCPA